MIDPVKETASQQRPELHAPDLLVRIATALRVSAEDIHLFNIASFPPLARYLYGLTYMGNPSHPNRSFFKLASNGSKRQLEMETQRTALVRSLGLPCVEVVTPYVEIPDQDMGIASFRSLDVAEGMLFPDKGMVAATEPNGYGALAARAILNVLRTRIPKDRDTTCLKRDNPMNASKGSFWQQWARVCSIVMADEYSEVLSQCLNRDTLQTIIGSTEEQLRPLISRYENSDDEWLVHNDQAPTNMFFPDHPKNSDEAVILIDWEHAGAVRNRILATINECGDFYRSCPNLAMQRDFLEQLTTQEHDIPNYLSDINERSAILKAAVVFGTILHSASRMDEHNLDPRFDHREAAFLLNNLTSNLAFIDELRMEHTTLAE